MSILICGYSIKTWKKAMKVEPYLKILAEKGGSDLYFSTGAPPSAKFNDVLKPLSKPPAPPDGWIHWPRKS
jgi:Tfp pilus assembly ATPase PilU